MPGAASGQTERHPRPVQDGKGEPVRHDADDRVHRLVDTDGPAEDSGVAAELPLPLLVREHDDRRRVGTFIFWKKCPSEQRRHARQLETGRGDRGDPDQLCAAVLGDEIRLSSRKALSSATDFTWSRH